MIKIKDLTLDELYQKSKITPSIETAILLKENFSEIQPRYCETVCRLKCKSYKDIELNHSQVDVLILQDHDAYDDGYKEGAKLERINSGIILELCKKNLKGLSYKLLNVLKCQLQPEDIVKGKAPTSAVQLKCAPYLREEIRRSNPKVIISLTNNATKALGLKKSNYTNRGEVHSNCVLTLHPKITLMIRQNASGKMWGPDYWDILNRDFIKAGRLARAELKIPTLDEGLEQAKKNIFITRTIADVQKAVAELKALKPTQVRSFDTETTGLDPMDVDAKLITIQFGYRLPTGVIRAIVIPLWHRENKGYDANKAWQLLIPILVDETPNKIGHNLKFDILYTFFTTGIRIRGILSDTMLALHNLNSGVQGNYGLKVAVWDWLPESGLGGYEDRLPKLTKVIEEEEESVE